jgi:hypothetical protein
MSNTSKQVVFQRAGKGLAVGISNEELHNWLEKSWNHAVNVGNYDRFREALNFEVRRGGRGDAMCAKFAHVVNSENERT